jgi:hypothetical protein
VNSGKCFFAALLGPEAFADLKNAGIPGRQEALPCKVRRRMQKPCPGHFRIDMGLRRNNRNATGASRLPQIILLIKKLPDCSVDFGPKLQIDFIVCLPVEIIQRLIRFKILPGGVRQLTLA